MAGANGIPTQDFIGFWFDGKHSSEFKLMRVSNGSRYDDTLTPAFKDNTQTLPGRDGTLYWDSYYTQRPITINVAFDELNETLYHQLRLHFDPKKTGYLIFDELPYKAYRCKLQSPPQWKVLCFDKEVGDRSTSTIIHNHQLGKNISTDTKQIERVYKGEGTLNFICYDGYARALASTLPELENGITQDKVNLSALIPKQYIPTLEKMMVVEEIATGNITTDQVRWVGADLIFNCYTKDKIKNKIQGIIDSYIEYEDVFPGAESPLQGNYCTKRTWEALSGYKNVWVNGNANPGSSYTSNLSFDDWLAGKSTSISIYTSTGIVESQITKINNNNYSPFLSLMGIWWHRYDDMLSPAYDYSILDSIIAFLLCDLDQSEPSRTVQPIFSNLDTINLYRKEIYNIISSYSNFKKYIKNILLDTNANWKNFEVNYNQSSTYYALRTFLSFFITNIGFSHIPSPYQSPFEDTIYDILLQPIYYDLCRSFLAKLDKYIGIWEETNLDDLRSDLSAFNGQFTDGIAFSNWGFSWGSNPTTTKDYSQNLWHAYDTWFSSPGINWPAQISNLKARLQNFYNTTVGLSLLDNTNYFVQPQESGSTLYDFTTTGLADPAQQKNILLQDWLDLNQMLDETVAAKAIGSWRKQDSSAPTGPSPWILDRPTIVNKVTMLRPEIPNWNLTNKDEWSNSVDYLLSTSTTVEMIVNAASSILTRSGISDSFVTYENQGRASSEKSQYSFISYNVGDILGHLKLYFKLEQLQNNSLEIRMNNQTPPPEGFWTTSYQTIMTCAPMTPKTSIQGTDIFVCWDSLQQSIYGVYYDYNTSSFQPTGTVYNNYIISGDFIPIPQKQLLIYTPNVEIVYGQLIHYFI